CRSNKQKEPPGRRLQSGWQIFSDFPVAVPVQVATSGLSDSAGTVRLSTENSQMLLGGKYSRIFLRRTALSVCDSCGDLNHNLPRINHNLAAAQREINRSGGRHAWRTAAFLHRALIQRSPLGGHQLLPFPKRDT